MTHLVQHLAQHPASQQLLALVTSVDAILRNGGFTLRLEQVVFLLRDHHSHYLSFSKAFRPTVDAYLFEALGFLKFGDLSSIPAPLSIFVHPPGGFNFSQESNVLDNDKKISGPRDNIDDSLKGEEQGDNTPQGVFKDVDETLEGPCSEALCEDQFQPSAAGNTNEEQGDSIPQCVFEDADKTLEGSRPKVHCGNHFQLNAAGNTNNAHHGSRRANTVIPCLGSEERLVFDRGKLIHLHRSFGS